MFKIVIRKTSRKIVKWVCTAVSVCMCCSCVPASSAGYIGKLYTVHKRVSSAKLTKKNLQARKAYKLWLEDYETYLKGFNGTLGDVKAKFALLDLDSNGVDELLFYTEADVTGAKVSYVYTYKGNKMVLIKNGSTGGLGVYADGTFRSWMWRTGREVVSYGRVTNGKYVSLLNMEGIDSVSLKNQLSKKQLKNLKYEKKSTSRGIEMWWYVHSIKGKESSVGNCNKWVKKFDSTHKRINPYMYNTAKNRSNMLKKRVL